MALVNDRLRDGSSQGWFPWLRRDVWPRGLIDGQCPCKPRSDTVSPSPRPSLRMQIGPPSHYPAPYLIIVGNGHETSRECKKKSVRRPAFYLHLSQYIDQRCHGKSNLSCLIDWRRALKARSSEWSREMRNDRGMTNEEAAGWCVFKIG